MGLLVLASTNVPAPIFVRPNEPLPVNRRRASLWSLVGTLMVLLPRRFTLPEMLQLEVQPDSVNAPAPPSPTPLRVIGSARELRRFEGNRSVAPEFTIVSSSAAAFEPSVPALSISTVPALMVVLPE